MPIFGVVINSDGEVVNFRKSPRQGDDCDGLVYKATDKDGQDYLLFLVNALSQDDAVIIAQQKFKEDEYVALSPIWQPGSVWPDKADDGYDQQAVVQIYSRQLGYVYITTVPTHGKTNPFIDCYGDEIMWAYMRDIEERLTEEFHDRQQEHKPIAEVQQEREADADPTQAKQLSFDFG
jgi:hypothetical protein